MVTKEKKVKTPKKVRKVLKTWKKNPKGQYTFMPYIDQWLGPRF